MSLAAAAAAGTSYNINIAPNMCIFTMQIYKMVDLGGPVYICETNCDVYYYKEV